MPKTQVFLCLNTTPDCLDRPRSVRVKLTLDDSHPGEVKLYAFPGSEHHSCNHKPTQVTEDEYQLHFNGHTYASSSEDVQISDDRRGVGREPCDIVCLFCENGSKACYCC